MHTHSTSLHGCWTGLICITSHSGFCFKWGKIRNEKKWKREATNCCDNTIIYWINMYTIVFGYKFTSLNIFFPLALSKMINLHRWRAALSELIKMEKTKSNFECSAFSSQRLRLTRNSIECPQPTHSLSYRVYLIIRLFRSLCIISLSWGFF